MENTEDSSSTERAGEELFPDISPNELPMIEQSLCMNCNAKGTTNILLTRIPFFKEIVLMSFRCDECGYSNNTIQSAGEIAVKGVNMTLKVTVPEDLQRQVVKSDFASVTIPELEFEIPAKTQKGSLNTIEGFLMQAIEGLRDSLPAYMAQDPDIGAKIAQFVLKLTELQTGDRLPFTFVLDDPSGNSFIENPKAPAADPHLQVVHYSRTRDQNESLGMAPEDDALAGVPAEGEFDATNEVMLFETNCQACGHPGETRMKLTNIPHFKEVVIMSFVCDQCGHKSNEVKSGGAIEPLGKRTTLHVTDPEDMKRDVLKSETAAVEIPEIELQLDAGTLGGKFTTVEGLLQDVLESLEDNPFIKGDSSQKEITKKFEVFIERLRELKEGNTSFTLILDDPVGNSYIQNVYAPDDDPEMTISTYERTFEQNEELGLNDIKV